MEDHKKIVVVCGPTASGKTGLSIKLASLYNGEAISADSMQVYKNLDIGTAKVTSEEQGAIKHHLVDFLHPSEPYNVQIFTQLAKEKISEIQGQKKLPFIVGGTGLYIESLVNGISFADHDDTSKIKEEIKELLRENGSEYIYDMLLKIDPEYAKTVHPNNTVRVIRAIEVFKATGKTMSQQLISSRPIKKPYKELIIGLTYRDRQKLYNNINDRIDIMLSCGLLKEAEYVFENKDSFINSAAAIGYKEFFSFFIKQASLEDCIENLKQASRNYAKRQLTWFNRMENVNWLYIDEQENYTEQAIKLTDDFLDKD